MEFNESDCFSQIQKEFEWVTLNVDLLSEWDKDESETLKVYFYNHLDEFSKSEILKEVTEMLKCDTQMRSKRSKDVKGDKEPKGGARMEKEGKRKEEEDEEEMKDEE